MSDTARIRYQSAWNRLINIVEQQAQSLVRAAFSTAVREARDLAAGVYDLSGQLLAQSPCGTPIHANMMANSVGHFLKRWPVATMRPGDVFLTNDPWLGNGHLNDFTVVTPAFRGGRAVALFASACHVVDIGGRGVLADGRQVYEEGICIPLMKLAEGGVMNEWLLDIIRVNVRESTQVIGDLYSLAGCNDGACARLVAMLDEFGLENVEEVGAYILDRTRQGALAALARVTPGTYRNEMVLDGFEAPVTLRAAVTIGPEGVLVDFAGTSGVSGFGINVPLCFAEAYSSFAVKCILAPAVPNNAAALGLIRTVAPEGCILNAAFPSPVGARHIVGQMVPDLLFGCLDQAMRASVPAEGASCLWTLRLMGGQGRVDGDPEVLRDATPFTVGSIHSGGTGARPRQDGLSATAFPSGVRTVPVEVTETLAPILVWRKALRPDSGGAGTFRGGLGQVMEIENGEGKPFAIGAAFERVRNPARGRHGGLNGGAGVLSTTGGRALAPKGHQTIAAGDRLVLEMPGGGGWGDPFAREASRVAADVRDGYVSAEAARRDYGVVLDAGLAVDEVATAACRAAAKP